MSAIKTLFLLSLLALFLLPRGTETQATIGDKWSKLGKCTQVVIESLSSLAIKIVPTVYEMNQCVGFVSLEPKNGKVREITWYLRVTYEFFKKVVFDEPKCLHTLFSKIAKTIKPFAQQIEALGCLDDNDFII